MDLFLNFKSKHIRSEYNNYEIETGKLSFRTKLGLLSLSLLINLLSNLRTYITGTTQFSFEVAFRRLIYLLIGWAISVILFFLCIKYKQWRKNIHLLTNLSIFIIYLPYLILITIDLVPRLRGTARVDPNFLISYISGIMLMIIFTIYLFSHFILQIIYFTVLVSFFSFYTIDTAYLIYEVTQIRNLAWILVFCAAVYYKERSARLIFQKMVQAKREEQRWREMINNIQEGVVVLDQKAENILYKNKSIEQVFMPEPSSNEHMDNHVLLRNLMKIYNLVPRPATKKALDRARDSGTNMETIEIPLMNTSQLLGPSKALSKTMDMSQLIQEMNRLAGKRQNYSDGDGVSNSSRSDSNIERLKFNIEETQIGTGEIIKNYELTVSLHDLSSGTAILMVFSDLTDRLENLRLKEISDFKTRLFCAVSHELRTPLNGSMGMLQAAVEDQNVLHEVKSEYIQPALDSCKYLLFMINDILDYSQLADNRLRPNLTLCVVRDMVREVMQMVRFQVKFKRLELSEEIASSVPERIKTDENRLKQVILNLLSNAVKFTNQGSICLSITAAPFLGEEYLSIAVEDTGIGIKAENVEKLFQLNGKVEANTNNDKLTGAGLGLTISQSIAKMLGDGTGIHVVSLPGEGTKFYFKAKNFAQDEESILDPKTIVINPSPTIPQQTPRVQLSDMSYIPDERPLGEQKLELEYESLNKLNARIKLDIIKESNSSVEKPKVTSRSCTCRKVLIVDDNPMNLVVLQKFLTSFGCECHTALNGSECMKKINAVMLETGCGCFYNLIFMDLEMPVLNGFETTRIIRGMIESKHLPPVNIVACTAYASEDQRERCMECGMDDFMTKPVSKQEVSRMLDKWG